MDNSQSFEEQLLLFGPFYRPPNRFYVWIIVGQVRIVPVHPYADVFEDSCLDLDVLRCVLLAFFDEVADPNDFFNLFLVSELE